MATAATSDVDPLAAATAYARDGCVVPTEPLANMLRTFISTWNETRPPATGGQFAAENTRSEAMTVSAIHWLALETARRGRPVSEEIIGRMVGPRSRRKPRTELRIADALVTVIGHPEAFVDGTLRVRPNPAAHKKARAACCGGSGSRRRIVGVGVGGLNGAGAGLGLL